MAADAKKGPPSRIGYLAGRLSDLREAENRVGATPAAGAGPELARRRDQELTRLREAQQRVDRELTARRELEEMNRNGRNLLAEGRNEYTTDRRKAELKELIPKKRAERDAKKKGGGPRRISRGETVIFQKVGHFAFPSGCLLNRKIALPPHPHNWHNHSDTILIMATIWT